MGGKQDTLYVLYKKGILNIKTDKMKVKRWDKLYETNTKHRKSGMAITQSGI